MHYRQLGRSGLLVSELALGTMVFGEESQRSNHPKELERTQPGKCFRDNYPYRLLKEQYNQRKEM